MRRNAIGLLRAASAVALALATLAPAPAAVRTPKQYTIEQFMATTNVMGASFSPDEKQILYSSNETGIYNAYTAPVGGGRATPITTSTTDSTYAVSFFPKDARVLYTHDRGGDENNHLYVREADGKERDLTPGDKLKAQFVDWSDDDKAFYATTNERDARYFDVYRYDAATYDRSLVYKDEVGYDLGAISPDGKWIAFQKTNTTNDTDVYVYDVAAREMKFVTPHEGAVGSSPSAFSPDSKWLFFLTNEGGEFVRVRRYELATGKKEDVERADWDVSYTSFSRHGKYRVTAVNADGTTVVKL